MFKQWFKKISASNTTDKITRGSKSLRAVLLERLPEFPPQEIDYVCAATGVMVDVARSDLNISQAERDYIGRMVSEMTSLGAETAEAIVAIAMDQANHNATQNLHEHLRALNDFASANQKKEFLHVLFGLASADDEIGLDEERGIRLIAEALHIRLRQFSEIRMKFRNKRTVLSDILETK